MKTASLIASLSLAIAVSALACTGQIVPLGTIDGGPGTVPLLDASVDDVRAPDSETVPEPVAGLPGAACRDLAGPRADLASHQTALDAFQGSWELCSARINLTGSFPADIAGLTVAGGRITVLVKDGLALVPGAGAEYTLGVATSNHDHSYQLEFSYSGGGGNNFQLEMTADRSQLRLSAGTSGNVYHFGRLASGSVVPRCTGVTGPAHAYTSIQDTASRLAGKWQLCSGGINSPADTKGIEFARTNAFFLVNRSGAIVRGGTWDYERSLSYVDATGMNGPGSYQINLNSGTGGNSYFSRVAQDGSWLELDENTSGKRARYERLR